MHQRVMDISLEGESPASRCWYDVQGICPSGLFRVEYGGHLIQHIRRRVAFVTTCTNHGPVRWRQKLMGHVLTGSITVNQPLVTNME